MCRDLFGHHRGRAHKGIPPQGRPAHDRRVGPDGCPAPDQGGLEFLPAVDVAARVAHVGEDHRRAQENPILQDHAGVHRDVVLDFNPIPDDGILSDEHILPDRTIPADLCTRHDVAEMPDFGPSPNQRAFIDIAGGVDVDFAHTSASQELMRHVIRWSNRRVPDPVGQLDRWSGILDAVPPPRQGLLVNPGVQVCEAF